MTKIRKRVKKLTQTIFPLLIGIIVILIPVILLVNKYSTNTKIAQPTLLKFDEGFGTTIKDIQNSASGTITGATWNPEEMCLIGKCLYFDGNSDFIDFGDDNDFDFTGSTSFTISMWFRHAPVTSGTDVLVAKQNSSAGYKIQMESDGDLTFAIDDDASGFPSDTISSTAATYDDNRWHHVGAVKTTNTKIELFIDGASVASKTGLTGSGDLVNSATLYIGVDGDGASNFYQGYIDEVKIYTTEALTSTTIKSDAIINSSESGSAATFGDNKSYLSDGLVGYWKMDESSWNGTADEIIDSSGNGNHGQSACDGTCGVPTTGNGKYGKGVTFDAIDDRIQMNKTGRINYGTVDFTYSVWVKYTNPSAGNYGYIMGKYADASNAGAMIFASNTYLRFRMGNGAGSYVDANFGVQGDNIWHHLVASATRNGDVNLYVDGVLKDTQNISSQNSYSLNLANAFYLGSQGTIWFLNGSTDEARLYNRALSPSEVKGLYHVAPGPIAHWKLDEDSGTIINDSSGNNYVGTLSATHATREIGKYGKSIRFSAPNTPLSNTGGYINIPDNDAWSVGTTGQFTAETWVNTKTFPNDSYFLNKRSSSNYEWYLGFTETGVLQVMINSMDGGSNYLSISTNIASRWQHNTWHHVAFTLDTNIPTLKLYVDGKVEGIDTVLDGGSYGNGTAPLRMSLDPAGWNAVDSLMDEVKIYNYARTADQIVEDMNGGHPSPGSPVGSAAGYWKFDEGFSTTANDSGTNNLPLTLSAASWTNTAKFGKAFNGGNNLRATVTDNILLEPLAYADFSISIWFKSDGVTTAATEYLVSKQNSSPGYRMYFDTSGFLNCGIDDDSSSFPEDIATTTTDYYDSTWHHAVCVRDVLADKLYLYVDTELAAQDTDLSATGTMAGSSVDFFLGDTNGTDGTDEFLGDIDEVKYYNLALSPEQVKAEYNHGSATTLGGISTDSSGTAPTNSTDREYCIPGDTTSCAPPVAHWKMDENAYTTVYDSSGGNYNGTLIANSALQLPKWGPGKIGSALTFKWDGGTGPYVNLPSLPTISIPHTISLWFYPTSLSDGIHTNVILSLKGGVQTTPQVYLTTSNRIIAQYGSEKYMRITAPLTSADLNKWWHLEYIIDSDTSLGGWQMYLNGQSVPVTLGNNSGTYEAPSTSGTIGNSLTWGSFNGAIDDIRIYNYSRTPAQIAWDYNRGAPIVHYKFDECSSDIALNSALNGNGLPIVLNSTLTAGDSTGNNDSVGACNTPLSNPTNSMRYAGVSGKYNNSLSFDGTNDVVYTTDTTNLRLQNFTISAWVNPTTFTTSDPLRQYVLAEQPQGAWEDGRGYALSINSSGKPAVSIGNASGSWTNLTANTSLTLSTWGHIVVTYDGTNLKIYVNGKLDKTSSPGITISYANNGTGGPATQTFYVGAQHNNNNTSNTYASDMYFFQGRIDDVRIYNYTLTPGQIQTLYNNNSAVQFTQ